MIIDDRVGIDFGAIPSRLSTQQPREKSMQYTKDQEWEGFVAFERKMTGLDIEVTNVRIPDIDTQGQVVDLPTGPQEGTPAPEGRFAVSHYFRDNEGPFPLQVKVARAFTDRKESNWCSFAQAEHFGKAKK